MVSRIPRAIIKTDASGKVTIEKPKPRLPVGQERNKFAKAKREADQWKAKSK